MKTVLCLLPVEQRHKEKLERAAGAECSFIYAGEHGATGENVAAASIILGTPAPKLINASEKLELLQLNSAGAEQYVRPGVLAPKTKLTNSTGAYSKAVAEHGAAMLFMMQKKLYLYRDAQKRHEWADFGTVTSITDATVLVVGLGDIGRHFAGIVKALGAHVIGVKRRPGEKPDCVDELYTMEKLDEVLPRADVVFSVLPGTPAATHLYTAERFDLMKPDAIFINCGRGAAVENSVLFRGVRVKKGAVVKNCVLMQDTVVEMDAQLDCVVTDKNVKITAGKKLSGTESFPVYVQKNHIV